MTPQTTINSLPRGGYRLLAIPQGDLSWDWSQKDYKTVYKLMDDAYTFRPITGAEWRAMKASGEN